MLLPVGLSISKLLLLIWWWMTNQQGTSSDQLITSSLQCSISKPAFPQPAAMHSPPTLTKHLSSPLPKTPTTITLWVLNQILTIPSLKLQLLSIKCLSRSSQLINSKQPPLLVIPSSWNLTSQHHWQTLHMQLAMLHILACNLVNKTNLRLIVGLVAAIWIRALTNHQGLVLVILFNHNHSRIQWAIILVTITRILVVMTHNYFQLEVIRNSRLMQEVEMMVFFLLTEEGQCTKQRGS